MGLVTFPTVEIHQLIKQGRIVAAADDLQKEDRRQFERVRALLAAAAPKDLAEANRRYRILSDDLHLF